MYSRIRKSIQYLFCFNIVGVVALIPLICYLFKRVCDDLFLYSAAIITDQTLELILCFVPLVMLIINGFFVVVVVKQLEETVRTENNHLIETVAKIKTN